MIARTSFSLSRWEARLEWGRELDEQTVPACSAESRLGRVVLSTGTDTSRSHNTIVTVSAAGPASSGLLLAGPAHLATRPP